MKYVKNGRWVPWKSPLGHLSAKVAPGARASPRYATAVMGLMWGAGFLRGYYTPNKKINMFCAIPLLYKYPPGAWTK